jgi:DNA repair exonuclease SbcCD nuclease subunit
MSMMGFGCGGWRTVMSPDVGIITDTHFGARSESRAFADYFDQFLSNVFFPELDRRGIWSVIHLGDIVDRRKYINFVAADRMLNSFVGRLKNKHLTIIPGNHDCPYRESLRSNAVEVLLSHRDNVRIINEPTFTTYGLIIPWIVSENRESVNKAIAEAHKIGIQTVMGHFEMTGFEIQRGQIADTGIDPEAFYGFDCVLSGHYHHKSDKLNIHYLGAPYEITWSDYDDPKGFHIFNPETLNLEFVRNPYRMHYKIEYDDRGSQPSVPDTELAGKMIKVLVHARTQPGLFDNFMRELDSRGVTNAMVIEDLKLIEGNIKEAEVKDTLEILTACIDGMADTVDNPRLKEFLTDLYREAVRVNA